MPLVPMMAGQLIRSGALCWAVSPAEALAVWGEERQTWDVRVRFGISNYAVASSAGEHSGVYVLRSSTEIEYVDSLGRTTTIGRTERIRERQSIVAIPGGPILEAGGSRKSVLSSALVDGEWKALDTIPVNALLTTQLAYVSACSTAVMTVVDRLPNGSLDTTSYRYDRASASWQGMTNAFGSFDYVILTNGDILSLSNRRIVRRSTCDGIETSIGLDSAVDGILRLTDGSILAYTQRRPDTASSLAYISTDEGVTFRPHPAFEGIDDYLRDVVEGADGVPIASAGEKFLRIVDDTALVIPSPSVEATFLYHDLVPVLSDASRLFLLNSQCCPNETALYDLDAGRWLGLRFTTGERCSPMYAYPFPHLTVVNDQNMTGILRGMDTVATVIKDTSGRALTGAALQAVQLTADTLLLFVGRTWYTVDIMTSMATAIQTDWPRAERGYRTGAAIDVGGGIAIGSQPRRIVVGTTEAWNIGPDSMITNADRYGILVSIDGGRSWTMSNEGIGTDIYCWGMTSRHDTINALMGYVHSTWSAQAKMYRSEDQGRTWSRMNLFPVEISNRIRVSIAPDGTLYVAGGGLVRSSDGGFTWNVVTGSWGETELPTQAIVRNDHLVVATNGGFYVSMDPVVSAKDDFTPGDSGHEAVYWDGQAFVVRGVETSDTERIAIHDLTGRAVDVVSVAGGRFIPATPLPAGPYIVVGRTTTLVLVHGR